MASTGKILICDDKEGVRESLKLILGNNYSLIIVETPEAALKILAKDKTIKIALLDINLPQINGFELLNTIKTKYTSIKTIMITGYKSTETVSEASRLGAVGYILKPFKIDEILQTVKKHY